MTEMIKKSAKLFGCLLCAGIMCCFTYLSFNVIFNFAFTDKVGYDVYGFSQESEQKEYLYTFDFVDNQTENVVDEKWKEYEENGYTLEKFTKRSELSKGEHISLIVVTQLFCLIFIATFVIDSLLPMGNKDNNMVRIGAKKEDKLKGLKIASMASVPSFLLFVLLIVCANGIRPDFPPQLYMILNGGYWPLIDAIIGNIRNIGDLKIWQYVLLFLIQLIIPLIGLVSYYIGYKDYAFLSKLLYKKKKKG